MRLLILLILFGLALVGFILIARKGRQLRKSQPLPPPATKAYLFWNHNGQRQQMEVVTPFYFGRNQENDMVLDDAKGEYEFCIFYHHSRFAIQTLPDGGTLLVNGVELTAGYLRDGDLLKIGNQEFLFRCY